MGFAEAFLIVVAVLFGPVVVVVRVAAWLRRRRVGVLGLPAAGLAGAWRDFRWPRVRLVDFLAAMSLGVVAWVLWCLMAFFDSGVRC